jgi:hypothetical protein
VIDAGQNRQVTLRRAPRYRAFVLSGAALGALALLLVGVVARHRFESAVSVYLGLAGLLIGGLAGAGGALLAERR